MAQKSEKPEWWNTQAFLVFNASGQLGSNEFERMFYQAVTRILSLFANDLNSAQKGGHRGADSGQ
jgi:hypothetical protein